MIVDKTRSKDVWINEIKLPDMANMFLMANLCFSVFVEQSFLLTHTKLSLVFTGADFDETSISSWSEGVNLPQHSLLASYNDSSFKRQEPLSEGVIDVDVDDLIANILLFFLCDWLFFFFFDDLLCFFDNFLLFFEFRRVLLSLDELPDIILRDVIGRVGAAWDLIEEFAVWMFDFVGMKVILGLQIAQNNGIRKGVRLSVAIDLMQWLVQYLEFLLFHFDQRTDEVLASLLVGETGDGVVEFIAEGVMEIGGERGLVYAFLFVDDWGCFFVFEASVSSLAALFVSLPLLLLRVADSH